MPGCSWWRLWRARGRLGGAAGRRARLLRRCSELRISLSVFGLGLRWRAGAAWSKAADGALRPLGERRPDLARAARNGAFLGHDRRRRHRGADRQRRLPYPCSTPSAPAMRTWVRSGSARNACSRTSQYWLQRSACSALAPAGGLSVAARHGCSGVAGRGGGGYSRRHRTAPLAAPAGSGILVVEFGGGVWRSAGPGTVTEKSMVYGPEKVGSEFGLVSQPNILILQRKFRTRFVPSAIFCPFSALFLPSPFASRSG